MTLSLRQRRRQETAREIQMAALELAAQHGLENITTEQISEMAGVSTRTFFNYFPNKEAAAIGAPPCFHEEDKEALRNGTDLLTLDLKLFLDKHIEELAKDMPILRLIGTVLRSNAKARAILDGFLKMQQEELADCLFPRVNNPHIAAALASNATSTIGRAIFLWECNQDQSLEAAWTVAWDNQIAASKLLARSTDRL